MADKFLDEHTHYKIELKDIVWHGRKVQHFRCNFFFWFAAHISWCVMCDTFNRSNAFFHDDWKVNEPDTHRDKLSILFAFFFLKKNVLILFAQRAINIRFLYGCERVYGWWNDNFSRWLDLSLTQSERLWTVYGALVLLFVCHLQLLDTCLVYESYGTDHAVTNGGSLLIN